MQLLSLPAVWIMLNPPQGEGWFVLLCFLYFKPTYPNPARDEVATEITWWVRLSIFTGLKLILACILLLLQEIKYRKMLLGLLKNIFYFLLYELLKVYCKLMFHLYFTAPSLTNPWLRLLGTTVTPVAVTMRIKLSYGRSLFFTQGF